jgi:hypothetical protein
MGSLVLADMLIKIGFKNLKVLLMIVRFLSFVTKWGYALQEDALVHQISMVILSRKVAARQGMLHLLCPQVATIEQNLILLFFMSS